MSDDILDKDELLDEIDGDWEFLEESVEMLKEDHAELIAAIRTGVRNNDVEAVWQGAHTVKSMVGNFAAKLAYETALAIETKGRNNEIDGIATSVNALESEVQRLISALEALIAEHSN
ncbi:MAG: Hpt domain-containing protein [Gammaproteobacteria bacterium]